MCGQMSLIIDQNIKTLPLRKKDGARVIDGTKRKYKILYDVGKTLYIRRKESFEKQHRLNCKKCAVPIYYKAKRNSRTISIIRNALVASDEVVEDKSNDTNEKGDDNLKNIGKFDTVAVSTLDETKDDDTGKKDDGDPKHLENADKFDAVTVHTIDEKEEKDTDKIGDLKNLEDKDEIEELEVAENNTNKESIKQEQLESINMNKEPVETPEQVDGKKEEVKS